MSDFAGEAEQRRLGHNGVDIIDEFCEASIFDEAAKYLSNAKKLKLSNDQKLTFYALFKQATIGPCNTPKPSLLAVYERAKWNAWNDLGRMNKDEAIMRYLNELERVAPSWKAETGVAADAADDDDEEGAMGGGAGGDGAMIMPQSRPIAEAETAEADLTPAERHVWFHAGRGDFAPIREWIETKGVSIDAQDEEGRTPLHWAVDRGHDALVRALVTQLGANTNARDRDGATPLHYAALCDRVEIVRTLLQLGADPSIADEAGDTAAEAIRGMTDVTPEVLALLSTAKSKGD